MLIDCDTCEVRGNACGDCVVTFLLGSIPVGADPGAGAEHAPGAAQMDLDLDEQQALRVLADSGLVPPLRLVSPARSVTVSSWRPAADEGDERDLSEDRGWSSEGCHGESPKGHGMMSAG